MGLGIVERGLIYPPSGTVLGDRIIEPTWDKEWLLLCLAKLVIWIRKHQDVFWYNNKLIITLAFSSAKPVYYYYISSPNILISGKSP